MFSRMNRMVFQCGADPRADPWAAPWSARVPLDPHPEHRLKLQQADVGVGRGPGGPPHSYQTRVIVTKISSPARDILAAPFCVGLGSRRSANSSLRRYS